MPDMPEKELRNLLNKYKGRMEKQLNVSLEKTQRPIFSREYQSFKKELISPRVTLYE